MTGFVKKLMAMGLLAGIGAMDAAAWGEFTWPVTGRVTTTWYARRPYGYHGAIDIGAPYWRAVGPARSGTVSFRGWSGGYGNLVIVRHSGSYTTYYAHNIRFGSGGWVTRASTISYIGSTGNSTGPHCHFEIRRYGVKRYIPSYQWQYLYRGRAVPYTYYGL